MFGVASGGIEAVDRSPKREQHDQQLSLLYCVYCGAHGIMVVDAYHEKWSRPTAIRRRSSHRRSLTMQCGAPGCAHVNAKPPVPSSRRAPHLHPSSACAVHTCLDEPLVQRVDMKELLVLAAVLDAAAERVEKVKGAAFTQQQKLDRLQLLCRTLSPQQKPADTLAALGVFDYYPYLAALLVGHQWGPGVQQAGTAYLSYVSLLNQVVMMGTQLYNDALVPQHHKYSAHQIALLYVSEGAVDRDSLKLIRLQSPTSDPPFPSTDY
jgi:hypothetical protein